MLITQRLTIKQTWKLQLMDIASAVKERFELYISFFFIREPACFVISKKKETMKGEVVSSSQSDCFPVVIEICFSIVRLPLIS